MVKLIMTWNIRSGKETQYLEFLMRDFTRALMSMGVQPTDAWYAVWGKGPQVLAGGAADDLETMEKALDSDEWRELQGKLEDLVEDLSWKVVEAKGGFQI